MRTAPLCLLALVAGFAIPASAAFKCTDEKGRTHFEDTFPEACANVVTYELSRSGSVIRKIEPAAPKVDDPASRQKAVVDEKAAVERKRHDRVLLDSYASEREIDATRDRNVDMLKDRLAAAKGLAQKAQDREKELQKLFDSKGGRVSAAVSEDLAHARTERASADAVVARIEKEMEETQARFAADKARWQELRAAK